ncbi:hypothetical protein [Microbacterium hominis]|uniref:hypothetical protein n=1 Tax=Microbacterium hominis TaxID=162426 RepID=UPI0020B6DB1A|nr:hypothetical protein [Microbacterium hominis]
MLPDDAVDVGDVVLDRRFDLEHLVGQRRVDRSGGAHHQDLLIGLRIQRAGEGVRGLELSRPGDQPIEAGQLRGEGGEFGLEGGDEQSHRSILPVRRRLCSVWSGAPRFVGRWLRLSRS